MEADSTKVYAQGRVFSFFVMYNIYEAFSSLTTLGGATMSLLVEGDECTGSSTVDVFALGRDMLWGLCASLVRGGVGGLSVGERSEVATVVVDETLSTRWKRYIFFST